MTSRFLTRWVGAAAVVTAFGCQRDRAVSSAAAGSAAPPHSAEGFVTTSDSVRLWYRVVGTGPETVVVPAALYHRTAFDGLASATRRIVLYDSRGRGKSDSVPAPKTGLERDLADVDAIRRAVGAESIGVIAWSGMGMELFQYALQNPGRVTRMVQLASVGPRWIPHWDSMRVNARARTDSVAAKRLAERVAAGEFANDQAGLCREQARLSNPTGFADPTKAGLAPDVCDSPNEWPDRYAHYVGLLLETFGKYDLRADLPRVTLPRLVIHGESDNIPLAASREWVAGQPNARLLVIKRAAHWPHLEQPDATLSAIREFFDGQWPQDSRAVGAAEGRQ